MAYGPDELLHFASLLQAINAAAAQIPCDALTELVREVNAPVDYSGLDPLTAQERKLNAAAWRDTMRAFPSYRLEMEPVYERSRAYHRRARKAAQN